jgi:hypothetical protein
MSQLAPSMPAIALDHGSWAASSPNPASLTIVARRAIVQQAGVKEMLDASITPAPRSRRGSHAEPPRTRPETTDSLSRLLTCDRKPNGNRQIQLNRRSDVRYLQVGLSRQHPGNPRRRCSAPREPGSADLWAGRTMLVCRETADPLALPRSTGGRDRSRRGAARHTRATRRASRADRIRAAPARADTANAGGASGASVASRRRRR